MTPLQLARKYMEIVFHGDPAQLVHIVTNDLRFDGPFFQGSTADEYIKSLLNDPPVGFNFELVKSYEDADSACLFYHFVKSGINTPMAQLFKVREGMICEIMLVFDPGQFK